MIHQDIYNELTSKLTQRQIADGARRDEETPFGYVICLIRDEYNLPKTEGWDTAKAIVEHFNFKV